MQPFLIYRTMIVATNSATQNPHIYIHTHTQATHSLVTLLAFLHCHNLRPFQPPVLPGPPPLADHRHQLNLMTVWGGSGWQPRTGGVLSRGLLASGAAVTSLCIPIFRSTDIHSYKLRYDLNYGTNLRKKTYAMHWHHCYFFFCTVSDT